MNKQTIIFETGNTTYAYRLHTETDTAKDESFACAVLDIAKQYNKSSLDALAPTEKDNYACDITASKSLSAVYERGVSLIERANTESVLRIVREGEHASDVIEFYYCFLADRLPSRVITIEDVAWDPFE